MLHFPTAGPFPPDDGRLALALAAGAGGVLVGLRAQVDAGTFARGSLGDAGDAAAQAYLAGTLCQARPDDAVLSEEGRDRSQRLLAERVWIIDPLDGTREFAERTPGGRWRDDFSVHVALWRRGRGLTDGAVALPGRGLLYGSAAPTRSELGSAETVLAGRRRLRVAVSRTRPPAILYRLAGDEVELVPMGSTGVKAMAVLEGTVDAYVHAGGQYEWDSAAPVAVAAAAGLVASRLDGSALVYNKADPWSPDLLICHPSLVPVVRRMLASVAAGEAQGGS